MPRARRSTGPRRRQRPPRRTRANAMARQTKEQVEVEIAGLPVLSLEALRGRWRALYGNPAPRSLRRGLLIRAVAYQLQVKAFGGLSAATKKKLRELAVAAREGRFDPAIIGRSVKLGTRLMWVVVAAGQPPRGGDGLGSGV